MAEITKDGLPSLCSQLPPHAHRIPFDGLTPDANCLGEDIEAGDVGCVRADGLVYRTDATGGAAANASYHGFAAQSLKEGEPISLIWGERFGYGTDLVPATFYYPSGTVEGGLADEPAFAGQQPVAFAINETDIQCLPPYNGTQGFNDGGEGEAITAIAAITPLTDNSAGVANDTVEALAGADYTAEIGAIRNNFADLAAKINEIIAATQP